jgi:hypothetical protein
MCGMTQLKTGLKVCQFCDYEEKPIEMLSSQEIRDLMASYEYERIADGVRIVKVKNIRDIALRGAVAIPHFVTEIGAEAFSCCKFLARIELPKGLRSIGEGAFSYCRDLFDVFIPESVGYIGKGAFADCYDLGVISVAAPAQPEGWDSLWLSDCSAKVEWSSTDEE